VRLAAWAPRSPRTSGASGPRHRVAPRRRAPAVVVPRDGFVPRTSHGRSTGRTRARPAWLAAAHQPGWYTGTPVRPRDRSRHLRRHVGRASLPGL